MPMEALQMAKEGLEELDADKIMSAYANPFLFIDRATGLQLTDKHELQIYFLHLFSSRGCSFSDIVVLEADSFAAVEWTWSGVQSETEVPFRIKGASVIELRQGKIARETIYYDPRPALSKRA